VPARPPPSMQISPATSVSCFRFNALFSHYQVICSDASRNTGSLKWWHPDNFLYRRLEATYLTRQFGHMEPDPEDSAVCLKLPIWPTVRAPVVTGSFFVLHANKTGYCQRSESSHYSFATVDSLKPNGPTVHAVH
jgi:hypothetical protein